MKKRAGKVRITKSNSKKILLIAIIVLVLALIGLILNFTLTGKVVQESIKKQAEVHQDRDANIFLKYENKIAGVYYNKENKSIVYNLDENKIGSLYKNYIIKLEEKPLSEKSKSINQQKKVILNEKKEVKAKILNKLGKNKIVKEKKNAKEIKIVDEFENVLNGLVLELSESEKEKISSIEGIEIYEDQKVNAFMMDSVPLINADDVWQMQDVNGLNVTGKNITIAVIDTGVDYTHEDLGGCFGGKLIDADFCVTDGNCNNVKTKLKLYEETTLNFEGKQYDIKVNYIGPGPPPDSDIHAIFIINNRSLPLLKEDISMMLPTEYPIYVEKINYQAFDGGEQSVEFSIGEFSRLCPSDCESNKACKVIGGYDFINDDIDPMDDNGHGTHVAGIAAGNGILKGVAPDSKIYAYKVLDSGGSGSWSSVLSGIERATDPNQDGDFSDHVDIISMSLGGWGDPDDVLSQAIDNAVNIGIVAVIAAGNSGPSYGSVSSPGTARKAITIGATYKKDYSSFYINCIPGEYTRCGLCDENGSSLCQYWYNRDLVKKDSVTDFSSRGPVIGNNYGLFKPDVVAPGALICSARYDSIFDYGEHPFYNPCLDEQHVQMAGTSMATPIVSGAVALIKQAHPDWNPGEIKSALKNTAKDLGYNLNTQGFGRIDILEAISSSPLAAEIMTSGEISGESFDIMGTAEGNYTLYYAPNSGFSQLPEKWIEIWSSNQQVIEGKLCSFDLKNIGDGDYILKLVVKSQEKEAEDYSFIKIKNTEIIYPKNLNEYSMWDLGEIIPIWRKIIDINGTSMGYGFDNYTLELCTEDFNCTQNEISLENNGKMPIHRGFLGKLNVSGIRAGFYYIVLKTYYKNGRIESDMNMVYIENRLLEGWPRQKNIEIYGQWAFSFLDQPTIADIDNDGKKDIITAYGRYIDVLNYKNQSLPGFPVLIQTIYNSEYMAFMQNGPAVGDLNNDGYNEIVIGDNAGYLHVLNHDGSYVFEPRPLGSYLATPSIDDINNDNNFEIIVGDWGGYVHVLDIEGNELPGWPKYLETYGDYSSFNIIMHSPNVADLNKDGYKEIVIDNSGCDYSIGCNIKDMLSRLWVLNYDGSVLEGFPLNLFDNILTGGSILADVDNDGNIEIVTVSDSGIANAINLNGDSIPGFPINITLDYPYGSTKYVSFGEGLSVADLDKDGNPEIETTGGSCLFAYKNNGQKMKNFPVCRDYSLIRTNFAYYPTIADLYGDESQEIAAAMSSSYSLNRLTPFYALNHQGNVLEGFPILLDDMGFGNVVPIGDLDGDGDNELIINTWSGNVFVYGLDGNESNNEWSELKHDSRHTGCYDYKKLKSSLNLHLKLDNNTLDSSEYSNNGISYGNMIYNFECINGGCYSFNGANNWIKVNSSSSLNINNKITVGFWIKMKSNKTSWIIGKYPSSWAIAYYNQPNLANDTLVFVMNNAQKILKVSNFSKEYLGKFAYVALTYDGKKIIAYVNGMIKAETNYSESISNLPGVGISIGYFMGSGYFNGSIDDVKIYNRALNAKEINKEFNNYSKISNYLCINGDVYGNATALGYLALVDDCLSDELCVSGESSCFASDDSEDTGSSSCLDGQKAYDENWDSRAAWDKNGMCTINEIYYWNESFNNKILLESKAHATAQSKGHVNYYCYSYNISDYLLMRIENLTSAISTPRFFIPKDCIKDRYVLGLKEELVYDSGRQRIAPIFYYETKVLTAPS